MLLKKLIIAEDDDDTSYLLLTALGDSGFLCMRARNGEEALNLTRTELPDALLLDVMMPKMDGITVCQKLKSDVLLSRIPIMMLTSLSGVNDRVRGLESGADDYLPKPFDIRELTARVRALIRASNRERQRNPVTNLPSGDAIEEKVHELLKAGEPFSLLYVDIENYRSYADIHGYIKADEVVASTGKLLLREARAAAAPTPFVGHVGGDDFFVLCPQEVSGTLQLGFLDAFLDGVDRFYTDEERERGHLLVPTDAGESRKVDFMNPSVAEVRVAPGEFSTVEDLARVVTDTKGEVRRRTHSGLVPVVPDKVGK